MTAKTEIKIDKKEEIVDNVSQEIVAPSEESIQADKLAILKAKSQAKQMEQKTKIVSKKERSLNFGVLGSGHAGNRLAEIWYKLGYEVIAVNTAMQDLKFIDVPDSNKLLLEYGIGGASKELEIGKMAAETHRGKIVNLVNDKLGDSQVNILCLSLGGGSGAGSCEIMVDVLAETGKPVIVLAVMPMESDDVQAKSNTLETLHKLTNFARNKKIANLILIDNAKLETIYQHISQMDFYGVANKAIVEPLDIFNTLSSMPSSVKPLDPTEWSKMLMDGEGLSVYGELTVTNFKEDTAIAEAIINSLNSNLLAEGFDLKQSKYVGVIITANKDVWSAIPSSSITYSISMINDVCGSPKGVFKGIYTTDTTENVVKIYSFFSGLGLPNDRIEQLKKESAELQTKTKDKEEQRNLSLNLHIGGNETVSAAQKVKDKIAAKSSNFGKFTQNSVTDRRK